METLFGDFLPNTYEEWKENAIKNLKGADFNKKLKTTNFDGIDINPIYFTSNSQINFNAKRSEFPWLITEHILIKDIELANQSALNALNNGANAIRFDAQFVDFKPSEIHALLKNIQLEYAPVFFENLINIEEVSSFFYLYFEAINESQIPSNLGLDPIGNLEKGKLFSLPELEQLILKGKFNPNFSIFNIDGIHFKDAGANTIEEIAFTLAKGLEYLNLFGKNNITNFTCQFTLGTGSNYFMEIAKIRAFRLLFQGLLKQFNFSNQPIIIHSKSCSINKTIFDKHINMLRNTTESMAAIIGGADTICILPFDQLDEASPFGTRMSRNLQNILAHESYFDKVDDMAKGSAYIENLTEEICNKSWELLLQIEHLGGYIEAFDKGFVKEKIKQNCNKLNTELANRKLVLLGTNKFPDLNEQINSSSKRTNPTDGIPTFRLADPFEQIRINTNLNYLKTGKRKSFYLLTFGNLSMRKARANFATNFFGVGGFEIIESNGFDNLEMALNEIQTISSDYIVLCSDNESWNICLKPIFEMTGSERFILAGSPKSIPTELSNLEIKHFIFEGCNILKQLESL